MRIFDLINGTYEFLGGLMLLWDCQRLYRDKAVAGVNWQVRAYFLSWGVWNLVYYPSLDQWASFAGGCLIAAANLLWVVLAIHYHPRRITHPQLGDRT